MTVTGDKLATVLAWLSRFDKNLTLESFGEVALVQEGLAEILLALSEANPSEMDPCPIFWTLSQYACDLAGRAQAAEGAKELLGTATVQIERPAPATA